MEVKHAGPSWGLGMTLEEITLISQAAGAAKPTRILIDQATFGWSMLSYLFGTKSYSLSADVFKGELDAKVKSAKDGSLAKVTATDMDLADVPWLKSAINLPASGTLQLAINLDLPKQRAVRGQGALQMVVQRLRAGRRQGQAGHRQQSPAGGRAGLAQDPPG